jgi:hypothetical protein
MDQILPPKLTDLELEALRQIAEHPATRDIPYRVQSRLKDIGYAKEVLGGLVLTDDGLQRIAIDRLIASIRTFVEVRLVRVCPEGCPTRPAREMNPEKAGTGRAWPALNFPSAPHMPQLRELAFVEMQSCPRASSRALG